MKKILYVDMDGVLVDFASGIARISLLLVAFALVIIPIITQRKKLAALEEKSQV
jgi:beta-phosphoglucomutase-like phosphatase (HAD superfamily)